MKKIELKTLRLYNFKGVRNLSINFSKNTSIYGRNATGKTSIFDAFLWLLFGKDSEDRKDFQVKTLDENNQIIPNIDHIVTGEMLIDGEPLKLQRWLKEKHVKGVFKGNESILEINDVPVKVSEYEKKISEICPESLFKLITNTFYFNNSLKWNDRRKELMKLVKPTPEIEIAQKNNLSEIVSLINAGKNIEEKKAEIKAKIKKCKEELEQLPARINEADRAKPEPVNFAELENEKKAYDFTIEKIDSEIADKNKASENVLKRKSDLNTQIFELTNKIAEIKRNNEISANKEAIEYKQKVSGCQSKIDFTEKTISDIEIQISSKEKILQVYEKELTELSNEFSKVSQNVFEFDFNNTVCPTCKQALPEADILKQRAELEANFNQEKVKKINSINERGVNAKATKEKIELTINNLKASLKTNKDLLNELKNQMKGLILYEPQKNATDVADTPEIIDLRGKIEAYQLNLLDIKPVDISELQIKKAEAQKSRDEIITKLAVKTQIEAAEKRIQELNDKNQVLVNELLSFEKTEKEIELFTHAKIRDVEESINSLFSFTKFKMFNKLINESIEECCVAIVGGVEYPELNNAMKINCGLDIINTFVNHYVISAPVFIDNAEAVNDLHPIDSQVIRLVVTESDNVLRVE